MWNLFSDLHIIKSNDRFCRTGRTKGCRPGPRWCGVLAVFLLYHPIASWAVDSSFILPNWSAGSGHSRSGYTWRTNASGFGEAGWTSDDGVTVSGDIYPRSFNKTDTGSSQDANFVSTNLPPYKTSGIVLKVSKLSGINDPGWWVDYPYPNYGSLLGLTSSTNRMSFWLYHENADDLINTSSGLIEALLDVGTYNCSGGCPTEDSNAHWYIRLTGHKGTWIHYVLNNNPDHRRGDNGQIRPGLVSNYFRYFYKWYLAWSGGSANSVPYTWYLDNVTFSTTSNEAEHIGATWVGYWVTGNYWEIGLSDMSFGTNGASSISTYEIRWSTTPITSANFDSATRITPQYFSYNTNWIRNPNPWLPYLWTRFVLPAGTETNNKTIYFAMKDVSSPSNGDGHTAPSGNIRTIDYQLHPSSYTPPAQKMPSRPTINGVQ